jgi:hypothetical protein
MRTVAIPIAASAPRPSSTRRRVAGALFLLLGVITVSFVPVFSLEAEEGASRRNGIRFRVCVFREEMADPADPLNYVISPSALG